MFPFERQSEKIVFQICLEKVQKKQAGAELGQAQLKLGFDFTLIFFNFDFSEYSPKMEKLI